MSERVNGWKESKSNNVENDTDVQPLRKHYNQLKEKKGKKTRLVVGKKRRRFVKERKRGRSLRVLYNIAQKKKKEQDRRESQGK